MTYLNCKSLIISYFRTIHDYSFKCMNGAGGGIRTHDPRFRRPMLYPAELLPQQLFKINTCTVLGNVKATPNKEFILFEVFCLAKRISLINNYIV